MSAVDNDLPSADLRARHDAHVEKARTFRPQGVSEVQTFDFLETEVGKRYISHLRVADPVAADQKLLNEQSSKSCRVGTSPRSEW